MSIQLITDSSADLTPEMKRDWNIKIVPLYVHLGDEQFKSEELTTDVLFDKIAEGSVFPSSAAAGPYEYYQVFKDIPKEQPIIHFSIADGISSAYNHAKMGRDMLLEKEPDRKITIINTESATSGIILLINESIKKIEEGLSYHELTVFLKDRVKHIQTIFVLQSLDNLIRGGRLDKVRGTIAKTLNIKLLLHANAEGNSIEVLEKVRGSKKVTKRFINKIGELISETKNQTLVFTQCQAKERLNDLMGKVKEKYSFDNIITADTGPVISVYTGVDAVVMSFFSDKMRIDL